MAIDNPNKVNLKDLNAEFQRLVDQLKTTNQGWETDPTLKKAVQRLEALQAMAKNECGVSETYP